MNITQYLTLALATLCLALALPAAGEEFPDSWFWDRPETHTLFEGRAAPDMNVGTWSVEGFDTEDLVGQIVVVDFWATWCQPCIAAMPHNNELAQQYADEGVTFVGVCTSGDPTAMTRIIDEAELTYPNAYVDGNQVTTDWPIQWYPTYAVVDRAGVVRAIGLKPDHVEDVIESILRQDAEASGLARIRPDWYEGSEETRARLSQLENNPQDPPALDVEGWMNTDEDLALEDLHGKVVVIDFWATWSGPSIRAIERHNELIDEYGEDGLVIIGVCASLEGDAMGEVVQNYGIRYPVCVDADNRTNTAYGPNGYPDYYVIDRAGNLRIADCTNASIEDAIVALLSETVEALEQPREVPIFDPSALGQASDPEAEDE